MGLAQSKKSVDQWDSEQTAAAVESLGSSYAPYANAIKGNAIDGPFLLTLSAAELQETMDDLGIVNRLHRRVVERKLKAALLGERDQVVKCESQSPSMPFKRTKTMEEKAHDTKKLLDMMTEAAEQQMLERFNLMEKEAELVKQIRQTMCNRAA